MPSQEKATGKRGKSLTLAIGVGETTNDDGDLDAGQPIPEQPGQTLLEVAAAGGAIVDTSIHVDEDTLPVPQTNEIFLPADETETASKVLLCIVGVLNGIDVTFLIDSGATECFLSTMLVENNTMKISKTKEKLKI